MSVFDSSFFYVFVVFFLLHEGGTLGLDFLNYRHAKNTDDYPELYRDQITEETFRKSKAYTLEKIQFSMMAQLLTAPFLWILMLRGGFEGLDLWAAHWMGQGSLSHSVVFVLLVMAYFAVPQLPIKFYGQFVIEQKHGFNNMTVGLFIADLIKGILMGLALGVPLLFGVFYFMRSFADHWWIAVWLLVNGFQFLLAGIYPTFIAPLFNRFEPLPDGALKEKILALARQISFPLAGLFVVDGSRRSGHSNAYFAGMGRFRRIVLFDTLIKQLDEDELLGVLAHEMGHNVKHHIRKSMILSALMSLAGFYVLAQLLPWAPFHHAFGLSKASIHSGLVIFMLISDVFTFALVPLMNGLSRKHEYEADAFAVEHTCNAKAMGQALLKLSRDNLSNLNPHPWYSFFHYSHPTTVERVEALQKLNIKSSL